jgi:PDDEXK-like domain of unknown function (DUF3799)
VPDASIIHGLAAADYHEIQALSASMALTMVEQCAARAWVESPFNPDLVVDHKPEFDIGTALHLAILEPDQFTARTVQHAFDAYRTNESKAIRDDAYEAGKTPLKPADAVLVAQLRDSILDTPEVANLLAVPGNSEVTLEWQWDDVRCKCRPDYLAEDRSFILDLKTSTSAEPRQVSRKAYSDGWHVRAAFYLAGVQAVTGRLPDHYWFAVVEKDAPFITQLYELDERALIWGEQLIGRALTIFAQCQKAGVWPKYRQGPSVISLPAWAEHQMADQEYEYTRPSTSQTERGNAFLRP